jgi:hypothetical protein
MDDMKKLFVLLFFINTAVYSQNNPRVNVGSYAGDGTGDVIRNAFIKTNQTIDSTNALLDRIHNGIFGAKALKIGGTNNATIDSIDNDGSGLRFYSNGSPMPVYTPSGNGISISSIKTIAKVVPSAGDTSYFPVPDRCGMIYIDSTGGHVYISKKSGRNNWVKIF